LRAPVSYAVQGIPPPSGSYVQPRLVTVEEQRAALWLREYAEPGGTVVTNVMCVPTPYEQGCEHTAYWVAALTGHPVVMGGWAYTETARQEYVEDEGRSYKDRPSPYPQRQRLSLAMIRNPSAQIAQRLRTEYDARWIFADRRATEVSLDIRHYADLVYANDQVVIYSLR